MKFYLDPIHALLKPQPWLSRLSLCYNLLLSLKLPRQPPRREHSLPSIEDCTRSHAIVGSFVSDRCRLQPVVQTAFPATPGEASYLPIPFRPCAGPCPPARGGRRQRLSTRSENSLSDLSLKFYHLS